MWKLLLLPACLAIHTLEPLPRTFRNTSEPEERWLNVRLNHFMASETTTFPMRFYFNKEFQGNDIVIFVGGEWEISPSMIQGGLAYDLAKELNAGLFYTEHRYYGLSRPTENTSTSELRYLMMDQALGDLAQFIQYVKSDEFEGGVFKNGKVALLGCSYSASMATWMRFAYPHLIDAVYSDSGPLEAKQEFPEYLEAVTKAIRELGSQECVDSIEQGMEALGRRLLEGAGGLAQVSQMFNTCAHLQSSPLDVTTFYWHGIIETFAELAQTSADIESSCAALTDSSIADSLQRLANWVTSRYNTQPCIEARYSEAIAQRANISFSSPRSNDRLWAYQTCIQFGWYQTTSGSDHVFLSTIPVGYFQQMCKDLFDNVITESNMEAGIHRTNTLFGGLTYPPDRVVSILGSLDPWASLGADASLSSSLAPVYVIQNGGHCGGLGSLSDDNSELERKKRDAFSDVYYFMTGQPYLTSSGTRQVGATMVVLAFAFALM